jgi:hypothetical protein
MNTRSSAQRATALFLGLLVMIPLAGAARAQDSASAQEANALRGRMLAACTEAEYTLTPAVRDAYLAWARTRAAAELEDEGVELPAEFLSWVDSIPEVRGTVYGMRSDDSGQLLKALYSLRHDLGQETFELYHQLALAGAVSLVAKGGSVDLTPHPPLTISIGGDPRVLVDTMDESRELDRDDHIINFLNERSVTEKYAAGSKKATLLELRYEVISAEAEDAPEVATRTRSLVAADVIASPALQEEFNTYMAGKGFPTDIDSGDQLVHWKSKAMIRGPYRAKILAARNLFIDAYKAKGYMPAERDATPPMGERLIYLIRNHEHEFTDDRRWPQFSLHSPWPTMTLLVDNGMPLREREDLWVKFVANKKIATYGEYVGSIAQQSDMLSARRVAPIAFSYGSTQMHRKDGGVCGVMANIGVSSYTVMGIPACTAAQPGHCALIQFDDSKGTGKYKCRGGQYASGGDAKTSPHGSWYFSGIGEERTPDKEPAKLPRRAMIFHQCTAWAVNHGMPSFTDAIIAQRLFHALPEEERDAHGMSLLLCGMRTNPFNIELVRETIAQATTPAETMQALKRFREVLDETASAAGGKPNGLYLDTIQNTAMARIAKQPVPIEAGAITAIDRFLTKADCKDAALIVRYKIAAASLADWRGELEDKLRAQIADIQADASKAHDSIAKDIQGLIVATAGAIEKKERKAWAMTLLPHLEGSEVFIARKTKVYEHPAYKKLASYAGVAAKKTDALMTPLMDALRIQVKEALESDARTKGQSQTWADQLRSMMAKVKDIDAKRAYLSTFPSMFTGKETLRYKHKGKWEELRDQVLAEVERLLAALDA